MRAAHHRSAADAAGSGRAGRSDRPQERRQPGHGDLAGRVASVLELPGLLKARAVRAPRWSSVRFAGGMNARRRRFRRSALDRSRLRKMLLLMAAAIVIPAGWLDMFPDTANLWARRMFLASREPWPQNTYLQVAGEHDRPDSRAARRAVCPAGECPRGQRRSAADIAHDPRQRQNQRADEAIRRERFSPRFRRRRAAAATGIGRGRRRLWSGVARTGRSAARSSA